METKNHFDASESSSNVLATRSEIITAGASDVGNDADRTLASARAACVELAPGCQLRGALGTRFELLERLGSGGMAVVFLARDMVLDRTVAIKFLANEALSSTDALDRIRLEAQACARLNHENIVRLFDIGRDKGLPFLVMEHLEGRPLDAMVRHERVDARRAVRIMIDVARGLSHAHRAGIVHRDLKPSNVFVAKDGTAKIVDFGVATLTARPDATHEGLSGTPRYMSPEQWKGEAQDGRTDVWAAGVMLFELLAGYPAFNGGTLVELRDAVVSSHPAPSLRDARPDLPEEADRIVQRATKKESGERFGTADELLDALVALEVALAHAMRNEPERGAEPSRTKLEHRQTTVLSCSLAHAAASPGEPGLDDLGESLDDFLEICTTVMRQLGGTILSSWGVRVVACFGYPMSGEDDAQRALRAAFLIVDAIRSRMHADRHRSVVHIGIGTGLTSARRVESANATAAPPILQGDAPHMAQWLEQRSGPNEILIGRVTQMLVRSAFEFESLGEAVPEGGTRPMRLYRVLRSKQTPSRFDPVAGGALTPLVGRDRELDALRVLWNSAKTGNGRFVLIMGEAGIGKSRLLEQHLERIAREPHAIVRCQCWPHLRNSALQPIAESLLRKIGLHPDAPAMEKVRLLEAELAALDLSLADHMPILAAFFGVTAGDRYPLPPLTPDSFKKRTLAALVTLFTRLAHGAPLILIVEDAHWCDGTTVELLDSILSNMVSTSLMLIVTARTEFEPPWPQRSHLQRVALARLSPQETAAMIAFASQGRTLPPRIVEQLVQRTDGIPLFIEELTHRIADAMQEAEQQGDGMDIDALAASVIPETLEGLLRARLDALPREGREVAALVAVLGRDATYDLIHEISEPPEESLRIGLMQLLETGILRQQGHGAEMRYTFKHALVKEAAYRSLVKTKRRALHRQVADVLLEHCRGLVEQRPELVARHLMEAGCHEEAASYFDKAGQRAAQRLANDDSAAHFGHALDQLRMLPKTPARDRRELALELARSTALVADAFGLSADLARELVTQAERSNDSAMAVYAHSGVGLTALMAGDFVVSRDAATAALASLDVRARERLTPYFGIDPIALSHVCLMWSDGLRGQLDRALDHASNAIQRGHDSGDAFSLTFAKNHLALWRNHRGEFDEGLRLVAETVPLCKGDEFVATIMASKIIRGSSRVGLGDHAGVREIEEGVTQWCEMGMTLGLTNFFAVLACAQLQVAALDDAMRTIDRAMDLVEAKKQRFFEAELIRIRGEILHASGHEPSMVLACFSQGLEVARRQHARAWELRLAHGQARLLVNLGRPAEARRLLAPVLAEFTEGFDTADVRRARTLLDAL